jgi:hypothetical protein
MVSQVLTYRLASGVLSGQLGNKTVHFKLPPTGRGPRRGRYHLTLVNHGVYGAPVVLMTPIRSEPTYQLQPNPTFQYDSNPTFQYDSNPTFQYNPNPAFQYDSLAPFQYDSGAAFVLSANALPVQNNLALGPQAQQLVTALRAGGAATLIVA